MLFVREAFVASDLARPVLDVQLQARLAELSLSVALALAHGL